MPSISPSVSASGRTIGTAFERLNAPEEFDRSTLPNIFGPSLLGSSGEDRPLAPVSLVKLCDGLNGGASALNVEEKLNSPEGSPRAGGTVGVKAGAATLRPLLVEPRVPYLGIVGRNADADGLN
jgi:hypothetical protein